MDSSSAQPSADEVDPLAWRVMTDVVAAAGAHDRDLLKTIGFRAADEPVATINLVVIYSTHLLKYRTHVAVGRMPNDEDLARLAREIFPSVREVIDADLDFVEQVFLTAFDRLPPEKEVRGGRYMFAVLVLLGLLLDYPGADLASLRPELVRYCKLYNGQIEEMIAPFRR